MLFEKISQRIDEACINEMTTEYQNEALAIASTNQVKRKPQDSQKHITSYIKCKDNSHGYGLYRLFFSFIVINGGMMTAHVLQALYKSSSATIVENLIDLNMLVIDLWNVRCLLEHSLNSYLLWDDKALMLDKKPSEAYKEYSEYFRKNIIERLEYFENTDFGDYTKSFRGLYGDYSFCDGLKDYGAHTFLKCGEGPSNYVDQNIVIFLKGMMSVYDEVFDLKTLQFQNPNITKEIMMNPKFRVTQGYFLISLAFGDLYYIYILPLTQVLQQYITTNQETASDGSIVSTQNKDLIIYCWTFIPAFILCIWACWNWIAQPFILLMRYYWSTLRLIPFGLIEKNPIMKHHFNRVDIGMKRLVEF